MAYASGVCTNLVYDRLQKAICMNGGAFVNGMLEKLNYFVEKYDKRHRRAPTCQFE